MSRYSRKPALESASDISPEISKVAGSVSKAAGTSFNGLMAGVMRAVTHGVQINSLADLAKPCRVEPLVIIDKSIVNQPYMEDLMKMSLSQFAAYYLQAVNMLSNVGRIETLKMFDTLNPNRTMMSFESEGNVFSSELYSKGLPSLEAFSTPAPRGLIAKASLEADGSDEEKPKEAPGMSASSDKIMEAENLAVGKLLNVEISDPASKKMVKLPVLIRMIPAPIDSDTITHIFSAGGKQSWSNRLFLAKTGQIRFWRDLVLGMDIVDQHFNALVKDKTGVYKEISDRRRNNLAKSIATGRVSMADASNVAIVSSETLKKSASAMYGKIEQPAVRKAIFDNSYLLMLMVVDQYYQRVTIYHRGLDIASTYRIDEIQMKERGKGQDITEIFKMFSKQMQTNI